MKKIMQFILLLSLMLITPMAIHAGCKAPERGPPGPQGPAGTLASAYVTSFNEDFQPITVEDASVTLLFPNNLTGPVGITHSSPDQFQVVTSGVYEISWILRCRLFGSEATLSVFLFVNGSAVTTTSVGDTILFPTTVAGVDPTYTISGSLYLSLNAGDIVSLAVAGLASDPPLEVSVKPFFSMALIAP
jgi:hypothetical protein